MASKRQRKPRTTKAPADAPADRKPQPPDHCFLEAGTASAPTAPLWDVPGWLLSHSLNMLEGRKGVGKSSIAAALAAHFAGGPIFPGAKRRRPSAVVWYGGEESWQAAMLPRLIAAGADPAWCFRLKIVGDNGRPTRLSLPSGLDQLSAILRGAKVGLFIMDPFSSAADPGIDLRVEQHVRHYLEPLAEILGECGTTGLLTRHLRKGTVGDALDAGLGSVGVGNVARVLMRADRHPTDDELRVLSVVAVNHGERAPSLLYRIVPHTLGARIEWSGTSQLSADVLAEGRGGAADRDEVKDAQAVLRGLLAEGARQANAVLAEGRAAGIGERTMRRAKAELGVLSERRQPTANGEAHWYWLPPPGGWPTV